jgi:hypothetical protein
MKISQLPQEVKEKALKYQRNADKSWSKTTDRLVLAFDWHETEERENYWSEWGNAEFNNKNLLERIYDKVSNYLFGGINCNPKG